MNINDLKLIRQDIVATTKVHTFVPISVSQGYYLYNLARNQDRDGSIIDIGTGAGFSSLVLALGVKKKGSKEKTYSIDILSLEERIGTVLDLHKKYGVENMVEFIDGKSQDMLGRSSLLEFETPVRIILIDGSHEYEDVVSDIDNALRLADKHTRILLDDYFEDYEDVCKAVNEAIKTGKIRVTNRIGNMLETKKVI